MGYGAIFDGEGHWLEVDGEPGWSVPFVRTEKLVRVEGSAVDALETADPGIVVAEGAPHGWALENGWSAFSVMLQGLCEVLGLPVEVYQENTRDSSWTVTRSWYFVQIGYDPESEGYVDMPEGL